ncbi:MAG: helix-turn-helix domain-containing protein [Anaerolineae bacterium]
MDVKQVARYLQLEESTIYSWAQEGKIPAKKVGGRWHFRRSELEAWLDRHRQDAHEASAP